MNFKTNLLSYCKLGLAAQASKVIILYGKSRIGLKILEMLLSCIIWYVVFIFSVTCHEAAHAFAAFKLGDQTAWHGGLATLAPIPHIQRSPFGMVLVPLFSFFAAGWMIGWASAPYDPYWAEASPKKAAYMALAGPAANLALVIVASLLIHLGISVGTFHAPDSVTFTSVVEAKMDGLGTGMAFMVSILFTLNLLLFVFNLIPVAPLDGTALGEFILKGETLRKYRKIMADSRLRVFGIFIAWVLLDFIFGPVHLLALNLLYIWRGYTYS